MIHLNEAVIVEGKYDKIKLSSIIDAVIIQTNGFSVFKDKEKMAIIRYYAQKTGIIILTDSDTAGFKIRNYLKGSIKNGRIYNVYSPDILGKEKRKTAPSKEGKLGVEGIDIKLLIEAFEKAGITASEVNMNADPVTRIDLFELGLTGGNNSSEKRKMILKELQLPELLTTTGMLDIINTMMKREEFIAFANNVLQNSGG